ncbi:MAG: HEAT repeat domain-containing protein, partial [Candidatus Saccharimonas sp.]|nr:HEAT repeat domain-containing protein [Planctomycetaceae bacterium]
TIAKAELDTAKATASTGATKIIRSAEQVQWELENTLKEPAPVSPFAAAASKSSAVALLSLCPDARGDVREQVLGLNTSDVEVLKRNVHRIGRTGPDAAAAAPALEKLLKHKDGLVRIHAALALARMQQFPPHAVQTVVDGLKASDPGLRSFAAATLAEMGPQAGEALAELANSLDDRDGYVRLHAAEVLIRYEQWSYRSLETLLGCLTDRDENVRWLATYSLAELAPESPEAVVALSKATRDPVIKVQTGAVYALGEIGPFAKKAAPGLHRLSDETTQAELQSAILYSLQQIEQ